MRKFTTFCISHLFNSQISFQTILYSGFSRNLNKKSVFLSTNAYKITFKIDACLCRIKFVTFEMCEKKIQQT